MSQILLLVSLGVVVMWTFRLAVSKGFKPWIWAGASIALLVLPKLAGYDWNILGMLPMLVLLFLRRGRRVERSEAPVEATCPKCQSSQAWGHRFCDRCGSEMESAEAVEPPRNGNLAPTSSYDWDQDSRPAEADPVVYPVPEASSGATAETAPEAPPESTPDVPPETSSAPEPPPVAESIPAESAPVESTSSGTVEPPVDREAAPENPPESEVASAPEPPAEPPKVFSGPPTPTRMTERGLDMLRDGLLQQAIDQFTKAIALDPNFKLAWEHRAEAYERMGRNQQAAEDRRRLEAF